MHGTLPPRPLYAILKMFLNQFVNKTKEISHRFTNYTGHDTYVYASKQLQYEPKKQLHAVLELQTASRDGPRSRFSTINLYLAFLLYDIRLTRSDDNSMTGLVLSKYKTLL